MWGESIVKEAVSRRSAIAFELPLVLILKMVRGGLFYV
jgi:hypothetical protein